MDKDIARTLQKNRKKVEGKVKRNRKSQGKIKLRARLMCWIEIVKRDAGVFVSCFLIEKIEKTWLK